jgi:electron transfer flavoprotein alpha subunit
VLSVIPVRSGVLPAGALETVSECGGRTVLIGSGTAAAAAGVEHVAREVAALEAGDYRPAAWTEALAAGLRREPIVVLPASPDGRDLAPRLAARLQRPLFAQAMSVSPSLVELIRRGGSELQSLEPPATFVATLQPGVRGVDVIDDASAVGTIVLGGLHGNDAELEAVVPPDPATIDLTEADRIVAAGAGLDGPTRIEQLAVLGAALGASIGATRVVTDRGWVGHERQIGTTGVVVDPELYIAFGISGAVQHTTGLGRPDHLISVNVDPYCPMMQLADLALVADANAVLDALVERIGDRG